MAHTQRRLKKITSITLRLLLIVSMIQLTITSLFRQPTYADFSSPAFACDGSFYQVRTPGTNGTNTSLYRLVLDQVGNYTEQEIGALSGSYTGMNGLGYNPLDGYLYGFITTANGGTNYHLYRVDDAGVVTDMGLVTGLSDSGGRPNISGATFNQAGQMYVMHSDGSNSMIRLSTVDLSTMTATYVTLSEAVPQGDLAIDPTSGLLYGVDAGANQALRTIDPITGAVTSIGNTSRVNGSAFFDIEGNLYASGNSSGNIYSIDKTTGVYTIIATGPAASSSDGATCAFSPRKIDTIKSLVSSAHLAGNTYRVQYQFGIRNTGTTEVADNVQIVDKLDYTFSSGAPTITVVSGPSIASGPCTANGSFDGTSDIGLLSGSDDLAVGAQCFVDVTIDVTYPNPASIPATPQANQAYASSSASAVNDGHHYVDDGLGGYVIVPPAYLQAADTSTNSGTFPGTANADTPSTTPVTFTTAPVVRGYKSVAFTDNNGNGTLNPGDTLTYTVTYRNTGNASELNFQITDAIPAGTAYVGGSLLVTPSGLGQIASPNGAFNGTSTTDLLAAPVTLVYDGMIAASFSVTINAGFLGALNNQASGDGDTIAPVPSDALDNATSGDCQAPSGVTVPAGSLAQACTSASDDVTAAVSVANDATVTVSKTDGATTVNPGDTLTYTITVANPTSDSNATNLVVTDTLPANVTFVSASNGGVESGGVVTWNIASLAGGSNVVRTVTVTVNSNAPDNTVLTNTAVASSTSDSGLCARSGSSCTGVDNNTVVDMPANVVDPPSGYKTYDAAGLPVLHWKMVWINDANSSPERVRIVDPLDDSASYVAGSLSCAARGASSTISCSYDSNTNSIIWEGIIGADPGATDEATAANEVVIELNVSLPDSLSTIENQALAYWDENGDNVLNAGDQNVLNNLPVLTKTGASLATSTPGATVFRRSYGLESTGNHMLTTTLFATSIVLISTLLYAFSYKRAIRLN